MLEARSMSRWATGARGAGLVAIVFAVTLANFDAIIVQVANPEPPKLPPTLPISAEQRIAGPDGVTRLGPCWLRAHRGQHVLYLEGDPFTLGYCNSRLTGPEGILGRQEQALFTALDTFVPSKIVQHVLLRGVLWTYRALPESLHDVEREEI